MQERASACLPAHSHTNANSPAAAVGWADEFASFAHVGAGPAGPEFEEAFRDARHMAHMHSGVCARYVCVFVCVCVCVCVCVSVFVCVCVWCL